MRARDLIASPGRSQKRHRVMLVSLAATMAISVSMSACLGPGAVASRPHSDVSLKGAWSTFDLPFFDKVFREYKKKHNVSVNYQPIGSGGGIAQFTAQLVDFGASDVPMTPSELAAARKAGGEVEQVPLVLGGESVVYKIPGVGNGLHLSGDVLARIYLGKITKWNDKAIRNLNKKIKLPSLRIIVVHRSDSSGTSFIFTDYLSHVSKQWKSSVGASKAPNWPTGIGAQKNAGVAATLEQQPGSIGYVELAYAIENHIKQAKLRNRSGNFVGPNATTVAAGAAAFPKVSASKYSIVNGKGAKAYGISGYSWVLIFRKQKDKTKGKALVSLMRWVATTGQKYAKAIDYVPTPKPIQKLALKQLKRVKA